MSDSQSGAARRPSLPIGWDTGNSIKVVDFIERRSFTQIYRLSDETFLYIFDDEQVRKKIQDRMIEHESRNIGGKSVLFKRYRTHSHEELIGRLEAILVRKGLHAVAGMDELKQVLIRDVVHPFLHRDAYSKYKLNIPNGILLFGPPGCGKTYIAKRIAEEINAPLIEIRESNVGSAYIHATSGNIAKAFSIAFEKAPAVVFIDEVSGLLPKRDGLPGNQQYKEAEVNEFLMQIESAGQKGVLVIAATNYPDRIDTAILRSGRMDKRIFVPPPDYNARVELFKLELDDRPLGTEIVPELLGRLSEGFVASDIRLVVDNAARKALSQNSPITMAHLEESIVNTAPSLTEDELAHFEQFQSIERK